jgi:hypothetical protein
MTTLLRYIRLLSAAATSFLLANQVEAQSGRRLAPNGLPRLADQAVVNAAAPLASNKYSEDSLMEQGNGAKAAENQGVKTLALDPARDWSRPLRGNPGEPVFVSLLVYGSPETVIEIGGVILGILESDISGLPASGGAEGALGYASLEARDASGKWRSLGLSVPLARYDGKPMAALPVLTIRLDPQARVYDVFIGATQLADNLPYDSAQADKPGQGQRRVTVLAGESGAMIMGLVQADENPLYEDANANGVDDRFEQQNNNRLLAATASVQERKTLAKAWRDHQARHPSATPALFLKLPLPDRE